MTEEVIVRRLTLIKHLYREGLEKAALPETISFTSILLLHDALDMFMNLAAEKKGIKKSRNQKMFLMEFFDLIPELTLKTSVNKINKRRNTLKHDGIVPAKVEIEDTCSVAKYFFIENTEIIFEKDFNEISIFDLITFDKVRELLKSANSFYKEENLVEAAEAIAKSYFHVSVINESLAKTVKKNPWYEGTDITLIKNGKFFVKGVEPLYEGQKFKESKTADGYVEITEGVAALHYDYQKAFSYIFQSLSIYESGLDYKKCIHFSSFMPVVYSYNTETKYYKIGFRPDHPKNITKENILFAIDFVMEFALKIQEFKY
jgi:hypothetical protein